MSGPDLAAARAHVLAAIDILAGECIRYDPEADASEAVEKCTTADNLDAANSFLRSPFLQGLRDETLQIWGELLAAREALRL